MKILYVATILAVYALFMLIRKTEKKQNLIGWLAISSITILCYNIFICLILTFANVLCTLRNLSICNFIIIGIFLGIIIKTKKLQEYYIEIKDIIFSLLILVLVILIGYNQYGYPFNVKYEITDGSSHYFFAQQFYEKSTLLFKERTEDILGLYNSSFRLPGAYINEGILFKIFDTVMLKIELFIIFDLFILYLSAILFYQLLKTYINKNKKNYVLAMIFSIIYMLGYQLNSMLYGYVYLSLALDIIIAFLLLMAIFKKEKNQASIFLPILSMISLGIFFSYAYFIPIIYISIILQIIIKSKINKEKIISSENIIKLIYLILIPAILGIAYFIIFPMAKGQKTEISTIGVNGGIYENYISNYLTFIPILIIGTVLEFKDRKNKKENYFETILFILCILFALILFIGYKFEIVSRYYFFKAYYIIWILAVYNTFIMLNYILEQEHKKTKIITYAYIIICIIIEIMATNIFKVNIGINDIFYKNFENITQEMKLVKSEEFYLIEKAEELELKYNETYVLNGGWHGRMRWLSVLLHNQNIYIDYVTNVTQDITQWLAQNEKKYYVAFYNEYKEIRNNINLDDNSKLYKIVYQDECGFILERIGY